MKMNIHHQSALVDATWLAQNLGSNGLKVVDASWYLPTSPRRPEDEYLESHIPGAIFFDIERIVAPHSRLPNTFPDPKTFSKKMSELGIHQTDTVVVYDREGIQSSPRAWWMFRQFGQQKVFVLDGGLHAWIQAGHTVESGKPSLPPSRYAACDPMHLCDKHFVFNQIGKQQIVDARSRERFMGTAPEPRPGLVSGHIPQSMSLPPPLLTDPQTRRFKAVDQIQQIIQETGIDLDQPIICTCGSGVGACVVLLALHELGRSDALLYDGSWTEWASDPSMPVVKGSPKG